MTQQVAIPLIQEINIGIEGIETAPANYPENLSTAILPAAIVFPGEGTHTGTSRLVVSYRSYYVDVYLGPVTQGLFDEPVQEAMVLSDLMVKTWKNLANDAEDYVLDYGNDSGYRVEIDRDEDITDSGWRMDMQWKPDDFYFGFRVTLPLMIRWGPGLLR
jgi:hypothetical protein